MAEQEGFEPSVQQKLYAGFRIRCIRPLCHRSAASKDEILAEARQGFLGVMTAALRGAIVK